MKKIIETILPLNEINSSAINEKLHNGHPGNMHLWWNRSPIESSAALLFSALIDDPAEHPEKYPSEELQWNERKRILEIIKGISNGDIIEIQNAKEEIQKKDMPYVADSFSGFGGLTLAAEKLGLNVQSSDLNSVAAILTKAAVEIPSRFSDKAAVNPLVDNMIYCGLQGLQEDVLQYGNQLQLKVKESMKVAYESEEDIYSWVWVRVVKCPNPACECQIPLGSSFVLSKAKTREYWAEPYCVDKKLHFKIHKGECPDKKQTNKVVSTGAKFKCPECEALTTDEYIKQLGQAGEIKDKLMAICVLQNGERVYKEPKECEENFGLDLDPEDVPTGSMPNNTRWFSPPGFGKKEYADLYLPRQLKLLSLLCNTVAEMVKDIEKDAILAGGENDGIPLSEGGTGALAYGQAVAVYLTLVIGKMANFQSTVCTWDNRKGNIRAAFTRQAIPMTYVFAEGNPFSKVTGNYETMLKNVVDSIVELPTGSNVKVLQEDGLNVKYPENAVLFTELPYLDNVGYADLSDYFYIWIRRSLRYIYPDIFEKVVTSKEELTSIPEHYGGDSKEAYKAYAEGMEKLFQNVKRQASDEYPSIVFFEYSKADQTAIVSSTEQEETCFEMILSKIITTGFKISAIWPIRTEKPSKKFERFRIAIVFRKQRVESSQTTRRGFINILKRELPPMLDVIYSEGMDALDRPIAGVGKGMDIFTNYKKVLNADGSDMNVQDALQIIYQEVTDYIYQKYTAELEDDTEIKEE